MPSDVDFRVMLTFVEFYATLMGFINLKLFHSLNVKYPPQVWRTDSWTYEYSLFGTVITSRLRDLPLLLRLLPCHHR